MPKPRKKNEGYDSALGSIFDFIFANNKSTSKPLRRRPTGLNNTDDFTRALAELAMNPGIVANDAAINSLSETFLKSVNFVDFRLDRDEIQEKKVRTRDPDASRFRIRGSDIGKAFSDPNKFVDKLLEGAKQDSKMARLTGAAAALDAALAVGIGLKTGMSMKEAMDFGSAANMSYSTGMEETHKRLLAENTAIKANMEVAKKIAESEGLDKNTKAFASRVQELVENSKDQITQDRKRLEAAIRKSRTARGSKLYGADIGDEKGNPWRDTSDPNSQYNRALAEVRSNLITDLGTSPDAMIRVDALMEQYQKEIQRSGTYGDGISGYRLTYAENEALHASLATTQAEREKHQRAANLALGWERMKGDGEYAGETIKGGLDTLSEDIKGVSVQIDALQAKATRTTEEERELKQLMNYRKDLNTHRTTLSQLYGAEQQRVNKSGDYWRNPNIGNVKPNDVKFAREGAQELINADISRLRFEILRTEDRFERRRLTAEMLRLKNMGDQLSMVPGSELRNRLNSWLVTGRMLNSQFLRGGFGGGLINGTAFFTDASGASAPGQLANIQYKMVNKDGKTYSYNNKIVLGRDDINVHTARLSSLYYLTPGSIIKTLFWNQEGFDFLAESRRRAVQRAFYTDRKKHLESFILSDPSKFSAIRGLINPDGTLNKEVLANNYLGVIKALKGSGPLPKPLQSILKRSERNVWITDRLFRLGKIRGKNNKGELVYRSISQYIGDFIELGQGRWPGLNKIRGRVLGILKKLSSDPLWTSAINKYIAGVIGVRQVINTAVKMAIKGIATLIGVVPGGIVISIIAWLGTEAIFKLAKPILTMMLVAVWGVCAIMGLFVFWADALVEDETIAHANMTPLGVEIYDGPTLNPAPGGGTNPPAAGSPPLTSICPISAGATCNQGPFGGFSHAKMGTYAIDLSPNAGVWKAPNNGEVTAIAVDKDCEWSPGTQSRGGELEFTDIEGNVYTLLHVVPLVGLGPVTQGTPVARVSTGLPTSKCWTGAHYHLEVQSGGGYVNSLDWYNSLGCSIRGC